MAPMVLPSASRRRFSSSSTAGSRSRVVRMHQMLLMLASDATANARQSALGRGPVDVGEGAEGSDEGLRAGAAVALGLQGHVELVGEGQAGKGQLHAGSLGEGRSEEHTSELQSLMRNSYAVFCLKK